MLFILLTLVSVISAYDINMNMDMPINTSFTLSSIENNTYHFNCYDLSQSITGYYRKQIQSYSDLICKTTYSCYHDGHQILCQPTENFTNIMYDISMWCEKLIIDSSFYISKLPVCTVSLTSELNYNDKIIDKSCFITVNITDNRSVQDKIKEPVSFEFALGLSISAVVVLYGITAAYYR